MKVGITLPQYGPQTTKENIIHLAMMAEQEQLDSVWVFERLLWPIHPQTPYPGSADGNLHLLYKMCLIQWKHSLLLQQKQKKLR
ncbi:hypothetical protein DYY65_10810 [Nitrososphaera sp. AFS]|jgi:alkanesulfonate monooxygenase SsuD/methylene tetrahydromethanopterin reductase-like flavin-dependent oxidoreductase (luciferase family)|nr:hypothetical protein [Nitrososphaera sp. AFS]